MSSRLLGGIRTQGRECQCQYSVYLAMWWQRILATSKVKQRGKSYSRPPVGYHLENTCPVPGPMLISITYLTGCWMELFPWSQHWQLGVQGWGKEALSLPRLKESSWGQTPPSGLCKRQLNWLQTPRLLAFTPGSPFQVYETEQERGGVLSGWLVEGYLASPSLLMMDRSVFSHPCQDKQRGHQENYSEIWGLPPRRGHWSFPPRWHSTCLVWYCH